MKVKNAAMATVLATALLGMSAAPQLVPIASGYAEEVQNATVQADLAASTLIEGTAEKDEIVYGSLTAAGTVKNLYVVNELFSETPAMVRDFGSYTEVTNLTDESSLVPEPDSVVCIVEDASFAYQGDLASKDLPWKVDISYELDGEKIAPEDLAGRTGALRLSIETSRNPAVGQGFFDNYLLQITCTMPNDHVSQVETEEGSLALAGSDTTVSFTGMPGKVGSYSLTAQIRDFEMEGISIAAIPFSSMFDMPDSDAIVSQFDELIEGTAKLDEGARSLKSGTQELDDGVQAMEQGTEQLRSGAEDLSAGVAAYVAGVDQLSAGLAQVAVGSSTFADKLEQLAQASEGIISSLSAVETRVQALVAQIQSSGLPDAEKAALIQQISGLSTQLGGLKDYAAGVGALSEGYAELDSSIERLSSGLTELSAQGSELTGGSTALSDATSALAGSTGALAQGADQLSSGASALSEGTAQLHEESGRIPDKVRAQIDALMSDYDKSDFEPTSFVDARNSGVKLVQFVMTTEAIDLPDPEPEEPEEQEETLLSRFFALFS